MGRRSFDQIAREAVHRIIAAARDEGYESLPNRAVFFVSDSMNLEGEITHWLVNHMGPSDA